MGGVCQVKLPYKSRHALISRLNGSNSFVMVLGDILSTATLFARCRQFYGVWRGLAYFLRLLSAKLGARWRGVPCRCVCLRVPVRVYVCVRVCRCAREKGLSFSSLSPSFSLILSFSFILFFFLLSKIYILLFIYYLLLFI